jgi:hypothetical protein
MNKNKTLLFIITILMIMFSLISCASATKKQARPFNKANKYSATKEVSFDFQTTKLFFVEAITSSGDIICKAKKNVPRPANLSTKKIIYSKDEPMYAKVIIRYKVWTDSREKTRSLLNALSAHTPCRLTNGKLAIDTMYTNLNYEYTADLEIIVPKDADVEWFVRSMDGRVVLPKK